MNQPIKPKRMRVVWLAASFLIFFQTWALAQQGREIRGQITAGAGQDVSYATVTLRTARDTQLVRGTATDSTGRFVLINVDTGTYVLNIQFLGMLPHTQRVTVGDSSLVLPTIVLRADSSRNTLAQVKIVGRRPFLRQEVDKMVVDIAGSVYSKGENAMRLFNVVPGAQVDAFGNILYRGTEAVTVYVDNVKVQLSGQQLVNYLRGIPSESIASYEVRSVGGAQFDANNTGTIININLKNEYKYGLSGSVGADYQFTRYNNFSGNLNLNYSVRKFTFQAAGSLYKGKQFEDQRETQFYKQQQIFSYQDNNTVTRAFFGNYKLGFDYRITPRQLLSANYEFTSFPYEPGTLSTNRFARGTAIDSSVVTRNDKDIRQATSQVNVLYRNKLDTLGSRLDIGYSYIGYDNRYDSRISTSYNYAASPADNYAESLVINNPLEIELHTFNADLEQKLDKAWTFNAGAKYNRSSTDNDIVYLLPGNVTDVNRSNRYRYEENILGFYGSFTKDWEKWGLKVGLRTENTKYEGKSVTLGNSVTFNRWSLFPSLFLQHKIDKNNSLTLSYSRTINRPAYQLLNPFENIQNPFYIETGNPFLLPFFTHKAELSYLLMSKYNFTLGYNRTTNSINNVYRNNGPVVISTFENINNDNNAFFAVSAPFKPTKWWDINASATLRYTRLDIGGTIFPRLKEKFSQEGSISNRFQLDKTFFAEVIARYGRNQFLGIYDWKPQGNIDINFKKNLLNEKLSLSLNFSDPFNLRRIGWTVDERDFSRDVNFRLPTQFVSFGVSYNFSSGKTKTERENVDRRDEEERGRLNK
ncbi:TonB-dependent receptor domain-containing protein [Pedobacter yulinensis]|nr:TonB-dependent receptor [Pedobacter yulinensis]